MIKERKREREGMAVFDTHAIKPGTTACITVKPDAALELVRSIIFRFADQRTGCELLTITYPDDTALNEDGSIIIALTQEDTLRFTDDIMVEAQYNYTNGHVAKTVIGYIDIKKTLGTTVIDGNTPDPNKRKALALEIVAGLIRDYVGVAFIPHVDDEGNLSWTNEHGLENPPTVNIKGDTPYIGENGNWWVGDTDTGTAATPEGSGGIASETDPTVPDWAKRPTKPEYIKSEVGLSNVDNVRQYSADNPPPYPVTSINGKTGAVTLKTSDLDNNSGYITIAVATLLNYYLKSETYAKSETYSRTDVDALISGLDKRLNAALDSDDTTLDQLSEIVAYIKSNKSLIDSITTSKVSVADIIDNLTTSASNKPLSAAQGVVLKGMVDKLDELYTALSTGKLDAAALPEAISTALAEAGVVRVTAQTFTDSEKTQARTNIGAASAAEVSNLADKIADLKTAGIIVVQDGDTLTIGEVENDG